MVLHKRSGPLLVHEQEIGSNAECQSDSFPLPSIEVVQPLVV